MTFGVPDYPLWWSVVTSLDVQAVGGLDVRVVCAQLALLTVAFVGAVARLLWDCVRPPVLAGSLLLLVLSPELWRHVQGGVADLPLAIYLALAVVAAARWLQTREPFLLALAGLALAVALQIKTEALVEAAALVAVGALFFARRFLWLRSRSSQRCRGSLAVAARRAEPRRARPDARRARARRSSCGRGAPLRPDGVLVLVPLAIVLALLARKPKVLLVPGALLAVVLVAYWIDRDEIGYVLATSAYRVIDPSC